MATLALVAAFASPSQAAGIDLSAPERGITDPLASVAPLDRNCQSGQVDVNKATADQIARALNLSSRPTVQRIIAGRPWLKTIDLVSVPGVPPSAGSRLKSMACATPTTLPMPTPLACLTNSRAVDLQSATPAAIANGLKLPRSVADGIVAARPLPQDLHQVATPRVPGLSDPKIDALLRAKSVCITPAVFTFAGTTWRWAYEQHGAVVADARNPKFALIVPARVTRGPSGAWGSIKIVKDTLPRADLHIHGAWSGEVAARLPDISEAAGGRPAVTHQTSSTTDSFSWGAGVVRESGGTVVAALRSLSEVTEVDLSPLCKSGTDDGSIFCAADSPRDTTLLELLRRRGDYSGRYASWLPEAGPCGTTSDGVLAVGAVPFSLSCHREVVTDTKASWRVANNSGVQLVNGLLTAFGTVSNRSPLGNHSYDTGDVEVDASLYGFVGAKAARRLVERHGVLLPGTSIAIFKNRGSGPSKFRHDLPFNDHQDMWALFHVLDVMDAGFEITGVSDHYLTGILDCLDQAAGTVGMPDLGTIKSCASPLIEGYLDGAEAAANAQGDSRKAQRLAGLKTLLKKSLFVLTAEDWTASFLVQLGGKIANGSKEITFDYLPPAPSGGSAGGGLAGDGSFIARTPSSKGYLVDPKTNSAREIANGGDFLCYASSRFVIDLVDSFSDGKNTFLNLDPRVLIDTTSKAPSCPFQPVTWTYTAPPAGNTPRNVILKGENDGGVNSAWLINSAGQIQTIPDGGTYVCLTYANPVIWNVPLAKINAWQSVGTEPARCG